MKTILLSLTYIIGMGELFLAIFFWVTNSKSEIRKVMGLFAFSMGMWTVNNAFLAYKQYSDSLTLINQSSFVFGILLITTLVHFAIIFPYKIIVFDRLHAVLLYVPALLFSIIAISGNTIVNGILVQGPADPGVNIGGPLYTLFNLYVAALFFIGLIILYLQKRRTDGTTRNNVNLVLWSLIFGGLPGVYLGLIAPVFGLPIINYLYGDLATSVWLGMTTYIISKK